MMEVGRKMNALELVNTVAWAMQELVESDLLDLKIPPGACPLPPAQLLS